ncbi:effector, partial [Sweet potato little leaf phytoplasma]
PKRSVKKQPIPKIKTTAARLEQMKKYLFSEPINPTLLPTDLSELEQEEIDKLKNSWGLCLDYLNKEKSVINEYQNKCDEYQSQLNLISPQITSYEQQKNH